MVTFIDDHRDVYGVEPICNVLPIAPSTDHERKVRELDPGRPPARLALDRELCVEIERVWEENRSVYGARKVGGSSCARASRSRAARWSG